MKNKCEAAKDSICLSMLCLIDYDCGCRDEKGRPKYDHEIGCVPAKKVKSK